MRTLLLLLVLPSLSAQDVAAPARYAPVRSEIAAAVSAGGSPSLAIAVVEDGELVWAEGFGIADVERDAAADADTIYRLASISKPFTATALMLLVERGQLELDAPVNRYLESPGVRAYQGRAENMTLRRLANHTAGLPTHWSFFYDGVRPPAREVTIERYGFAAWRPGSRSNYSNLAFGILDHVVERTAGMKFRDFLTVEVLDPLGMRHTDVGVRPGMERYVAVGYRRDTRGRFLAVPNYEFDHPGASAVRSSARDLARFALLHLGDGEVDGRRLLTKATVQTMRGVTWPPGASAGYGVSWRISREEGALCQSHSGGMPGVATLLQLFPEQKSAVAVLVNCGNRQLVNRTAAAARSVLLASRKEEDPVLRDTEVTESQELDEPGAAEKHTVRRFRGHVAHFDGPVPVVLELRDDGAAELTLGDATSSSFLHREVAPRRVRLQLRGLLRTNPGFVGTPTLDLQLERDRSGWSGVLYATGDSTFRLPHWVRLEPEADKADNTLRVVSYNILVGFRDYAIDDPYLPGVQRRHDVAAWLAAQRPDVVALQELNGYSEERLRREAAAWGHHHAVMLKQQGYPTGLTSRWPIEVVERRLQGLHHGLLHCRTGGVDFVVVHLVPMPGMERKLGEVEQVLSMYRAAQAAGKPVVLLGDFNAISPVDVERFSEDALERYRKWKYAMVDGRPAETAVQPILAAGAVDVFAAHRVGDASLSLPRIDFVFASPELAERSRGCRWLPDPDLLRRSDHPPVVADFESATNGVRHR